MKNIHLFAVSALFASAMFVGGSTLHAAQDTAGLEVDVVGSMTVTACNATVDGGDVVAGATTHVRGDAAGSVCFTIVATDTTTDWMLTTTYNSLAGLSGQTETIAVAHPATGSNDDICIYADTNGTGVCNAMIETGGTFPASIHAGDGRADVGYRLTVPSSATGRFGNASAVTLIADVVF